VKIGLAIQSQRVLYEQYRRRLDAREVLSHYGAENCTEVVGADGTTEIIHSCLLDKVEPHHKHGDQNPSACCNVDKKLYICYSYAGMDLFHFIARMEGKSNLGEIVPLIGEFLSGAMISGNKFQEELEELLSKDLPHGVDLPHYSPRILEPWKGRWHPYLDERGITKEAAELLQIGINEAESRVVFPNFFQGHLVGWQARALPGTGWPKYRNSSLFPKNETLYGYDLAVSHQAPNVIVVESPMSVAKAYSLGLEDVVATFGSFVSKNQMALLRPFRSLTIWMDGDHPGLKGERNLVEHLYRGNRLMVVEPERDRDLADYTSLAEVNAKLNQAVPRSTRLASYALKGRYSV
jgi:hypothetical protein